jgi:hypothetical protein
VKVGQRIVEESSVGPTLSGEPESGAGVPGGTNAVLVDCPVGVFDWPAIRAGEDVDAGTKTGGAGEGVPDVSIEFAVGVKVGKEVGVKVGNEVRVTVGRVATKEAV